MTPTPKLRFVKRNEPVIRSGERFDNWRYILQQLWEHTEWNAPGEWRDVPLEKEE
jgi:hypothetical protein